MANLLIKEYNCAKIILISINTEVTVGTNPDRRKYAHTMKLRCNDYRLVLLKQAQQKFTDCQKSIIPNTCKAQCDLVASAPVDVGTDNSGLNRSLVVFSPDLKLLASAAITL